MDEKGFNYCLENLSIKDVIVIIPLKEEKGFHYLLRQVSKGELFCLLKVYVKFD